MLGQNNPTGAPPTGWHAQAEQLAAGTNVWSLVVYAICST